MEYNIEDIKTAEDLFLKKFGNKLTASESWVIRLAEEYATIKVAQNIEGALSQSESQIKRLLQNDANNKARLLEVSEYFLTLTNQEEMNQAQLEIFLTFLGDKLTEAVTNYNK